MKLLPALLAGIALLVVLLHLEGGIAAAFLPSALAAVGFRAARAEVLPLYAGLGAVLGALAAAVLPPLVHRFRPGSPAAEGRWARALFPHFLLIPLVLAAVAAGDRDWLSLSLSGGVAMAATTIGLLPGRMALFVALTTPLNLWVLPGILLPLEESTQAELVSAAAAADRPDVVLVVLDTVRRDRPEAFGGPVPTPGLSRLASEGAALDALAASPWSVPSHVSLFTGLVPSRHGVTSEHLLVPGSVVLLAERFRQAGYETVGLSANPWVSPPTGLARGFTRWREAGASMAFESRFVLLRILGEPPFGARDKGGSELVSAFSERLRGRSGRPAFFFVNLTEAHAPYARIPRAARKAAGVDGAAASRASLRVLEAQHHAVALDPDEVPEAGRLYDAAVAHVDSLLVRLLAALDQDPRGRDAVVAVVSDHGEMLGEHGAWGHTTSLWRQVLEVPFVLRAPGRVAAGSRLPGPVGLVDVTPTLLELADLPVPEGLDGRSLWSAEGGLALPPRPRGLSAELGAQEGMADALRAQGRSDEAAALTVARSTVLRGPWRYERTASGQEALFDLASDPDERHNLAGEAARAELLQALRDDLAAWTAGRAPVDAAAPELSDERKERLRSLGYAQ